MCYTYLWQTQSFMLTSSATHMFLFTFTRATGSATPTSPYGLSHMFPGRGWLFGAGFCKHSHTGLPIKAHGSALLSSILDSILRKFTWTIFSNPATQYDSFFLLVPLLKTSVNLGRWSLVVVWYFLTITYKVGQNDPGWNSELVTWKRPGKYLLTSMVPFQRGMFNIKNSRRWEIKIDT